MRTMYTFVLCLLRKDTRVYVYSIVYGVRHINDISWGAYAAVIGLGLGCGSVALLLLSHSGVLVYYKHGLPGNGTFCQFSLGQNQQRRAFLSVDSSHPSQETLQKYFANTFLSAQSGHKFSKLPCTYKTLETANHWKFFKKCCLTVSTHMQNT